MSEMTCHCEPCPGRGNDGHAMTHCAECCWGTFVVVDLDCPIHGIENLSGTTDSQKESMT